MGSRVRGESDCSVGMTHSTQESLSSNLASQTLLSCDYYSFSGLEWAQGCACKGDCRRLESAHEIAVAGNHAQNATGHES